MIFWVNCKVCSPQNMAVAEELVFSPKLMEWQVLYFVVSKLVHNIIFQLGIKNLQTHATSFYVFFL